MRFFIAIALVLSAQSALAGSCRYYSRRSAGVTECENGYFEERRGSHVERYGERNGGFDRYPGSHYGDKYRPTVW